MVQTKLICTREAWTDLTRFNMDNSPAPLLIKTKARDAILINDCNYGINFVVPGLGRSRPKLHTSLKVPG